MLSTPFGRFPVSEEGERVIECAIQNGARYTFKLDSTAGAPVTLTGRVRRDRTSAQDYVLDTSPSA